MPKKLDIAAELGPSTDMAVLLPNMMPRFGLVDRAVRAEALVAKAVTAFLLAATFAKAAGSAMIEASEGYAAGEIPTRFATIAGRFALKFEPCRKAAQAGAVVEITPSALALLAMMFVAPGLETISVIAIELLATVPMAEVDEATITIAKGEAAIIGIATASAATRAIAAGLATTALTAKGVVAMAAIDSGSAISEATVG